MNIINFIINNILMYLMSLYTYGGCIPTKVVGAKQIYSLFYKDCVKGYV